MLKVNSIIAESHYNTVINKVAGNAISLFTIAHSNKHGDATIKKKQNEKKTSRKWQKSQTEWFTAGYWKTGQ